MRRGRVFVGKFSSYDSINEKVWFDAPGGIFNTVGYPLNTIRSVEPIDQVPAKNVPASEPAQ